MNITLKIHSGAFDYISHIHEYIINVRAHMHAHAQVHQRLTNENICIQIRIHTNTHQMYSVWYVY